MLFTEESLFNKIEENLSKNLIYDKPDYNINVLYSGGCDSTLVLFDILVSLKSKNDGRDIDAYCFTHGQLGHKVVMERKARDSFLKHMKANGYINNVIVHEIELPKEVIYAQRCGQPALWISNILPLIRDKSLIYAGYHQGDCFLSYGVHRDWLKATTGLLNLYGKFDVEITYPLQNASKEDILRRLRYERIYDFTWHCETVYASTETPCGNCAPCKLHRASLHLIELDEAKLAEERAKYIVCSTDRDIPITKDFKSEESVQETKDVLIKELSCEMMSTDHDIIKEFSP